MSIAPAEFDAFLATGAAIAVEVAGARGSTPRDEDAVMLVSASAALGTIGGGQLEFMAIDHARRLLRSGGKTDTMDIPLGPEIGQCCGGRVELALTRLDAKRTATLRRRLTRDDARRPHVYVFGAGHVGNALATALAPLPVRAIVVETRQAELEALPESVETRLAAMPEAIVREAPPGSAFVVLTHDHALDFLIVREALARPDAAYVGMIGSKTKRARYRAWHLTEGGDPADVERLVCPIGGDIHDKRPAVIAALTAAELLRHIARGAASRKPANHAAAGTAT